MCFEFEGAKDSLEVVILIQHQILVTDPVKTRIKQHVDWEHLHLNLVKKVSYT